MNTEDIERSAREAGLTPGAYLKKLADDAELAKAAAVETAAKEDEGIVKMQHVIITLSDGRRGVFMGPELIKEVEFKLGIVPRPVAIDFDPPRAVAVPVPRDAEKIEEATNAEQKPDNPVDAAPQAGLE